MTGEDESVGVNPGYPVAKMIGRLAALEIAARRLADAAYTAYLHSPTSVAEWRELHQAIEATNSVLEGEKP